MSLRVYLHVSNAHPFSHTKNLIHTCSYAQEHHIIMYVVPCPENCRKFLYFFNIPGTCIDLLGKCSQFQQH